MLKKRSLFLSKHRQSKSARLAQILVLFTSLVAGAEVGCGIYVSPETQKQEQLELDKKYNGTGMILKINPEPIRNQEVDDKGNLKEWYEIKWVAEIEMNQRYYTFTLTEEEAHSYKEGEQIKIEYAHRKADTQVFIYAGDKPVVEVITSIQHIDTQK